MINFGQNRILDKVLSKCYFLLTLPVHSDEIIALVYIEKLILCKPIFAHKVLSNKKYQLWKFSYNISVLKWYHLIQIYLVLILLDLLILFLLILEALLRLNLDLLTIGLVRDFLTNICLRLPQLYRDY